MTLPNWILEAKKRREAATPGPWKWLSYLNEDGYAGLVQSGTRFYDEGLIKSCDGCDIIEPGPNADFIASAPETQARMEKALEIALDGLRHGCDCGYYEPEHGLCHCCTALAAIEALGE